MSRRLPTSVNSLGLAAALFVLSAGSHLYAQTARFTGVQSTIPTGFATYGGMAIDSQNDIFLADDQNNQIVEITASGKVDLSLGGGTPQYVALDSTGNLYVTTTAPAALKKLPVSNGTYGAATTISTSFQTPWGVAVDNSGTIYVADHAANEIFRFVFSGGAYFQSPYVSSGINQPAGLAVDRSGNLYVADRGNSRIAQIPSGSSTPISIASGLDSPSGLAVDASGNLAVAAANGLFYEQANAGYLQYLLATNFNQALGVAFDASGAIYVADSNAQQLVKQTLAANFGSVAIGQTSAAQMLTFVFDVAGSLNGATPMQVLTMGATGLDFAGSGGGSCSNQGVIAVDATCTVAVTFKPTVSGTRNGSVVLYGSSGSVAATAYMTGTGLGAQIAFGPPPILTNIGSGLSNPYGVAVDGAGNVYIADTTHNRVVLETRSGGYAQSLIGSGLNRPTSVAVDGAGNVYIADTGNNRVLLETRSAGTYLQSTLIGLGLNAPTGVAVDAAGNVYIADNGNARVIKETLFNGTYNDTTVVSGVVPFGVAVDGAGNIYIAEPNQNLVSKATLSGGAYSVSTVAGNLGSPRGVAVDGAGNVYIADTNNNQVLRETLSGGSYSQSIVPGGFDQPYGIAVDGAGNLYLADTFDNLVPLLAQASPPSISFPNMFFGQTSAAQSVTVTNVGNQQLIFTNFAHGTNPVTGSDFELQNTCVASLAPGASCNVSYVFAPTKPGTFSETSVLYDNALNHLAGNATQTIILDGTAFPQLTQTITFPQPATPFAYTPGQTITLNATASSGLAVAYSVVSGPATVSGSTLTLTGTGTVSVMANQGGNYMYTPAAPVTAAFQIITQPAASFAVPNTSIGASSAAQTITLQFTVAGTLGAKRVLTGGAASLDFDPANGGTCSIGISYAVNETCTVNVVFSPKYAGLRRGAVTLLDVSGAPLATAYLQGSGAGPQIAFTPIQQGVAYNLGSPNGVAVDGVGNVYIADRDNNRVLKETLSASGVYVQSPTPIGSGLWTPMGVAVDGAGNVYIADSSNNRVLKETLSASGVYVQSPTPIGSGLHWPTGVAVDGAGNLYIADTLNDRVVKETLSAGGVYVQDPTPIDSGLWYPNGVAVDRAGNVYVADTYNNRVVKDTLSAGGVYVQDPTPIGSGLYWPYGVAVDGAGNVYIADLVNSRVVKETLSAGGIYVQSGTPIGSGLDSPSGVAVDGAGNVYIADIWNCSVVKENVTAPPTLTFPSTAVGDASTAQAVTVTNLGNLPLKFPVPPSGSNPTSVNSFRLESNSDTTCPLVKAGGTAGTLAANASCTLSYVFAPVQAGAVTNTAVLMDNNLNAPNAVQTIKLIGSGIKDTAAYKGLDTTTQGAWTGKYGANGYLIANDATVPPAFAAVSLTGDSLYTWAASTSDTRALQVSSGSATRIASTYDSASSFSINVNLTDGNAHRIALYLLDWDTTARSETVTILNAATNAVLDTETFSSFHNGEYAAWTVQGHVIVKVTKTGGSNAVVSGVFFN